MEYVCSNCQGQFSSPPGYSGLSCACPFCGTINTIETSPQENEEDQSIHEDENTWAESFLISKEATIALLIGLVLALVVTFGDIKFVRFIIQHFITLVHEFGHALFSWLQGYFAIPAFDFTHGGGMTITNEKANMGIRLGVFLGFTFMAWKFHKYKLILIPIIIVAILLLLSIMTNKTELVLVYMGHGTVLLMGGIFLFRGLSNVAVHHFAERVIYFFLGFFSILEEYMFTKRVLSKSAFRQLYLEGKGGVLNDFDRIGDLLMMPMDRAIAFHSIFCIITPLISYFIYVIVVKNYSR